MTRQTFVDREAAIASYSGDLPSPLQVMNYIPTWREAATGTRLFWISDSEIRGWIKNASAYHDVPHSMLAVILQQENGPDALWWQSLGQFAERQLTTTAAAMDEALWDIVPDRVAGSSTGFANMSRGALEGAVSYVATTYGRQPMPQSVQDRMMWMDADTRVSGADWRADLYYCSAHLRELIDRETGQLFTGALPDENVRGVFRRYNGSGPLAEGYANDAMDLLNRARNGSATLYFYQT